MRASALALPQQGKKGGQMVWRYLAGALAGLLLAGAGVLFYGARARPEPLLAAPPALAAGEQEGQSETALPETVPEATPKTREQKRFGRYDKDRDGGITRDEYLLSRRKVYAKLDANGDGRLSFEEWSAKTLTKFATADRDRSGSMNAAEFATTAVKRKARAPVKCPPVAAQEEDS